MAIDLTCPTCRKRLKAPDESAGKRVRCPCSAILQVPSVVLAAPPPPLAPPPPPVIIETSDDEGAGFTLFGFSFAGLRESLPGAVRAMLVVVIVAGALLVGGTYLLRQAIAGAENITKGNMILVHYSLAPAILAGFFGLAFGACAGRASTVRAGLTGLPAWALSTLGLFLLLGIGALAGRYIFPGETPVTLHMCLFFIGGMSMIGICIYSFWLG